MITILSPPAVSNCAVLAIDHFRPSHNDIGNLPSPPKRINYQDSRITPPQRRNRWRRSSPEYPYSTWRRIDADEKSADQ